MRSTRIISGVNSAVSSLLPWIKEGAGDEVYPKDAVHETRLD
jgi:hypothetical protein